MSTIKKEMIYEQWRNFLCRDVLNKDISSLQQSDTELTVEEIRTIFSYGYRLAMAQTMETLKRELSHVKESETIEVLNDLLDKTYVRARVSDCLNLYKGTQSFDDKHYDVYLKVRDKRKRIEELLDGTYGNPCSWASDERM
jgi:hypothetical protein